MAGTTPLNNQVPAKDPISKSIIMDDKAEEILLTILLRIFFHLYPKRIATIDATPAESIKMI